MQIRNAIPADSETLFDIRCSVRENHQSRKELAALGITPESVGLTLQTDCAAWIAWIEEHPVAFAMANCTEESIFAVFVRPGYESRGLGRALMAQAEQWLMTQGVARPWLTTGADPTIRANGFYLRLGWEPDGTTDDGQIRYVKELAGPGTQAGEQP